MTTTAQDAAATTTISIHTNAASDMDLEEGSKSVLTEEITASDDPTTHGSSSSFVDYTPPPQVKILPPAKYKLWILVFVLVYFASWVADAADMMGFLRFHGWLAPEASLFLMLAIIVFVLVYSTMDLVIVCLTFTTTNNQGGKKVHGVGAWLKQPRAQWVYNHENLFFEVMARIIHILEEGFAMFDAPPAATVHMMQPGAHQQQQQQSTEPFECTDEKCQQTLKIEHRIRPDKLDDYQKWVLRIRNAVRKANGLVGVENTEIRKVLWDEEEGQQGGDNDGKDDNQHVAAGASDSSREQLFHVVYVKFANLDYLNDWMMSPRRKALMRALEPMLVVPDIVQIQSKRELPDAFTDLLVRQGQSVAKSPPKKYKVWWLTLVSLFITIRWTGTFLPYYYEKWGLTQADERLERLVTSFVTTFLNSYIMAPLFLFLFDYWLHHSDSNTKNVRQPWKTFDEGFQSFWMKVFITFAFYGGCVIAAVVKQYQN